MSNSIGAYNGLPQMRMTDLPPLPVPNGSAAKSDSVGFQKLLLDTLGETSGLGNSAQMNEELMMTGGDITQVEVLASIKKADLALRTMIQVRNKMLDAYREVINLRM